jgi:hypothetical protein
MRLSISFTFDWRPMAYTVVAGGAVFLAVRSLVRNSSNLIQYFNVLDAQVGNAMLSAFTTTPDAPTGVKPGATHPMSYSARKAARTTMNGILLACGREQFVYQLANSDLAAGRRGCRHYFWPKDTKVAASSEEPKPSDVVVMHDVDYYVDMPRMMSEYVQPYLLYTMTPESVAFVGPDYSFTFDEHSNLRATYAGSGNYVHQLWNYSADTVLVKGLWFGYHVTTTIYTCEQRSITPHRSLVLLTPIGHWRGPMAWLVGAMMSSELTRVNPVKVVSKDGKTGKFTRLQVHGVSGVLVSTGMPQSYLHATIPQDIDTAIALTAGRSKNGITDAAIASHISTGAVSAETRKQAVMLGAFHSFTSCTIPDIVNVSRRGIRAYAPLAPVHEEAQDVPLSAFMAPISGPAYVPIPGKESEALAVAARITQFQGRDIPPMTDDELASIEAFITLLAPEPHVVHPYGIDDVRERLSRPAQRALTDVAITMGHNIDNTVKSFIKGEAGSKPSDPRVISTIHPLIKLEYSAFTYAAADALQSHEFIAMGKSPAEVARRITTIAGAAKKRLVMTDFHRFDGHINEKSRAVERAYMFRLFAVTYHGELDRLMKLQMRNKGRTKHGVKYESEEERLSGSPETSLSNTLTNAFIAFHEAQKRIGYQAAFEALGIFLGDDGMDVDADPVALVQAAADFGLDLVADSVDVGDVGVTFLSRLYGPDVWYGDASSIADPARAITKFHVGPKRPGVSDMRRFVERLRGYSATDENTPVIGDLIQAARRFIRIDFSECTDLALAPYAATLDEDSRYPNEYASWMFDAVKASLPKFNIEEYMKAVRECGTITDLMTISVRPDEDEPPPLAFDYQVNDSVIRSSTESVTSDASVAPVSSGGTEGTSRASTLTRKEKKLKFQQAKVWPKAAKRPAKSS